ncbi:hypothetical protein BD324DRAFT_496300 [Kockovaella imperatae]|uniref:Shugoshin C-terminal domain-containing protein n=1 Tax=Kockovaella imperatae TaxID=4999 RepID=A0A1Y1UEH2_9TREE|nr:hypothetical protein BD324DRAFT_496300 [Kockovaella imperatae]ORX36422.1 hypothetical protein BD324DRAFT_496300 [Kockovaella imperatae]
MTLYTTSDTSYSENALRKTTINALHLEITALRNELFAVKRANVCLLSQVKKAQNRHEIFGKETMDALEQLFAALPILQRLRDDLAETGFEADETPLIAPIPAMRSTDNPVATRPAATGGQILGAGFLGVLPEINEDGQEISPVELPVPRKGQEPKQPRASLSSLSHPTVAVCEDSKHLSAFPNSPSVTSFPRSPSLVKIQGRRRDSGAFKPDQTEAGEPIAESRSDPRLSGVTARRKGRTSSALTSSRIREAIAMIDSDTEAPSPISSGSANNRSIPVDSQTTPHDNASPHPSSATHNEAGPSTGADTETADMIENGLRGRRIRQSVNYKEPSLTKKMRKPDGLSLEETLKKSYSRPSMDMLSETAPGFIGRPTMDSTRGGGLRRKSALPKSGNYITFNKDEETTDDEEEVDSFLDLALGGLALDEKSFANSKSSSGATSPQAEHVPPRTSPKKTPPRSFGNFKASSSRTVTRVSPRKRQGVSPSKHQGSSSPPAKPRSLPAPKSAQGRNALGDLNYNPKIKSNSARKSALGAKDTTRITARRRLTSVSESA